MAFSDARTNVPQPTSRLHRDQAPIDNSTAETIGAAASFGGELRQGQVEGNLEQKLGETGNIIAAVNNPETISVTAPDGTQVLEGPESLIGGIDQTTDRFQRINSSLEQGKISQQRAHIEAETELRRSINRAPGFSQQLRRAAQDILGFNPSGALLNSAFLSGPDRNATVKQSQRDKDIAEGQAFFDAGMAPSPQAGLKLVVSERAIKAQNAVQSARISRGEISSERINVEVANQIQQEGNAIMLGAFKQIADNGSITDFETLRSGLLASNLKLTQQFATEMSDAPEDTNYKPANYDSMRASADRTTDAMLELIENQDVVKVMARNEDLMESILRIEAINLAPELAVLAKAVGERGVEGYIELMAASEGQPDVIAKLKEINPFYAVIADLTLNAKDVSPTLQAIASGGMRGLLNNGVDRSTANAVTKLKATDVISGRDPATEFPKVIDAANELDLPNMVMSTAAQTKNSWAFADQRSKDIIVKDFGKSDASNRANISEAIKNTPFILAWDEEKLEFNFQDRQGRVTSEFSNFSREVAFLPGPLGGSGLTAREQAVRAGVGTEALSISAAGIPDDALDSLNKMMVPLMKDSRWANHLGHVDPTVWATELIADVNQRTIEAEVSAEDVIGVDRPQDFLDLRGRIRLRSAIELGNQAEIFSVLEEAGLGTFNEQANLGQAMRQVGPNAFATADGRIIRVDDEGETVSVQVGAGLIDRSGAPESVTAGAGQAPQEPVVPLKKPQIVELIRGSALDAGIDSDLAQAIATVESGLKPDAKNPTSSATGLFQNTNGNFEDFGDGGDRTDPEVSTRAGIKFLQHVLQKAGGNEEEALRLWHDGQNSTKDLSPEGAKFTKKVLKELSKLRG